VVDIDLDGGAVRGDLPAEWRHDDFRIVHDLFHACFMDVGRKCSGCPISWKDEDWGIPEWLGDFRFHGHLMTE
jgi:hypothetical protein